ncbi:rhodanese domain protein [Natronomonas pharaonis DSM 2160]|uniref:Rhodanese domain protein n=1 Tax=Natronomonas pharaonis (strain ATCC 35678 / DSM 2160 / CIP 103997 / JCM 8858 / NBRC 14720 / NCIMB 2260 / Gabara) TaxID=348780 RepID=A0A1U7ETQ5_NATPD|nr:rhodanese-like domain-containing protein [Natronomonas pharaonis]CAI48291.1 rhodanese domain protein [Natronomonas pharaonis DSM 2160]
MDAIRPPELQRRLESSDPPVILDIRPREAYQQSAIEGSHNVPVYDDLRSGNEGSLRDRLDEVPDGEVVVVCKQGIVAKRATELLRDAGREAETLAGGMGGWRGYRNGTFGYKLRSLLWRLR